MIAERELCAGGGELLSDTPGDGFVIGQAKNKEFFVYNMDSKFSNGLIKVGVYKSFDVYLDLLMPPNEILLYCDREA